jgi:hypothetical protein
VRLTRGEMTGRERMRARVEYAQGLLHARSLDEDADVLDAVFGARFVTFHTDYVTFSST